MKPGDIVKHRAYGTYFQIASSTSNGESFHVHEIVGYKQLGRRRTFPATSLEPFEPSNEGQTVTRQRKRRIKRTMEKAERNGAKAEKRKAFKGRVAPDPGRVPRSNVELYQELPLRP